MKLKLMYGTFGILKAMLSQLKGLGPDELLFASDLMEKLPSGSIEQASEVAEVELTAAEAGLLGATAKKLIGALTPGKFSADLIRNFLNGGENA